MEGSGSESNRNEGGLEPEATAGVESESEMMAGVKDNVGRTTGNGLKVREH